MTKQNKILLGVGALALASYLVWKNKKKLFANASGDQKECQKPQMPCPRLAGSCFTPTRGGIIGTAPIGCFGGTPYNTPTQTTAPGGTIINTTPIPMPQQTPPIVWGGGR